MPLSRSSGRLWEYSDSIPARNQSEAVGMGPTALTYFGQNY